MADPHAWLTKQQAAICGKPILVPREEYIDGEWVYTGRWSLPRPAGDILLGVKSCAALGSPVQVGEEPTGYIYISREKTNYKYMPVYSRWEEQLEQEKLTEADRAAIRGRRSLR